MKYRAVFFDVGETLVHPSPSFAELFARVLEREGHLVAPDDVVRASLAVTERFSEASRGDERWTTSPERSRAFWLSVYELMLDTLELPSADGLRETLYATFTDRSNYVLFDDVVPAVKRLAEDGYALGLVSNFEAWLEDLLVDLGIRDAFAVRVISGIEGIEKPDPSIYALALDRAGVRAHEAAYVGDNPEFDVDPPAAIGMFPVLIDRRNRYPDHRGVRISDLADLPGALGG